MSKMSKGAWEILIHVHGIISDLPLAAQDKSVNISSDIFPEQVEAEFEKNIYYLLEQNYIETHTDGLISDNTNLTQFHVCLTSKGHTEMDRSHHESKITIDHYDRRN